MNTVAALVVVLALVAGSTALGLLVRRRSGRVATGRSGGPAFAGLDLAGAPLTLVQFSSPLCAPCAPTARVLGDLARTSGLAHVEVDISHRPDLARTHFVVQTPTTLVVDSAGTVRARIAGPPRPAELRSLVTGLVAS